MLCSRSETDVASPSPTCPWCGAGVERPEEPCGACQKVPSGHPSFGASEPLALPDLVLDLPSPPSGAGPASGSSRANGPSSGARPLSASGGDDFDDDDELGGALELAVDMGPPATGGRATGQAGADVPMVVPGADGDLEEEDDDDDSLPLELVGEEAAPVSRGQSPPGGAPPVSGAAAAPARRPGLAPLEEFVGPDPEAVTAFAAYGEVPTSIAAAPAYAIRAMRRRRELEAKLPETRARLADVTAARGEEYVKMVDRVRVGVVPEDALGRLVAPLAQYDQVTQQHEQALRQANAQLAGQLEEADRQIEALKTQRVALETKAAEADVALGRSAQQKSRAEASLKRVEIALRAAHEAARLAAGENAKFAPPEHAKKIKQLETEKQAKAAELAPVVRTWQETFNYAKAERAAVETATKTIDKTRRERRALEQAGQRQLAVQSQGTMKAMEDRRAAYTEIGRRVMVEHAMAAAPEDRGAVDRAEAEVREKETELAIHVQALVAADQAAVRRGQMMLGAVAAVALLVLVLFIRAVA